MQTQSKHRRMPGHILKKHHPPTPHSGGKKLQATRKNTRVTNTTKHYNMQNIKEYKISQNKTYKYSK